MISDCSPTDRALLPDVNRMVNKQARRVEYYYWFTICKKSVYMQ